MIAMNVSHRCTARSYMSCISVCLSVSVLMHDNVTVITVHKWRNELVSFSNCVTDCFVIHFTTYRPTTLNDQLYSPKLDIIT